MSFNVPFTFVDIETTGLSPAQNRVIEVAAIRVENNCITQEYRQLVNPSTFLPGRITEITGIQATDLATAPVFAKIAAELHRVLAGSIFVAHNVAFDYSFLQQEFLRLGMAFTPDRLCTMRLSRMLYPQHRTHKLQDLIDRHNLQVTARHRAYDDALALWQFMQHVYQTMDIKAIEQAFAKQLPHQAFVSTK